MLATYVIETVGTQEYELGRGALPAAGSPRRTAPSGRRGRAAPRLPAPLSPTACRSSRPPSSWRLDARARGRRRGPRRRRRRPRARHAARGLPQRAVPDGRRRGRRAAAGLVVAGPARGAAARRSCGSAGRCARSCRHVRDRGSTPPSTRSSPACADPARGRALDHARDRPARTPSCTAWAGRTRSRPGATASWSAACTGSRSAACSPASRCSTARTDASKVALVALADVVSADGDSPAAARRAVGAPRTWRPSASVEVPRADYCRRLEAALARPLPGRGGSSRSPRAPAPERLRRADDHHERAGTPTRRGRPRRATVRSSWPRIRHQAGTSWRAAGSVASTATTVPAAASRAAAASRITGSGQRRPRASTTSMPVTGPAAPSSAADGAPPRRAAPRGTASTSGAAGRHGLQRQGDPHVAVGEHPHRRQDVARLERARGAGRAGGHGEAAPVQLAHQRLAVDVQAGEGHHVRQPVDRVADDLGVGDAPRPRRGSGRPARRRGPARPRGSPRSAARPRRRPEPGRPPARRRCARPRARWPGRAGATGCARARPARRPRRGRPTSGRRRPARRTPSGGRVASQRRPWRPPAAARRGATARCQRLGQRLPRAHLTVGAPGARRPPSPARPGRWSSASRSTRPEPVHRDLLETVGVAGRGRVVAAEGAGRPECSTAGGDQPGAPAAPGVQQPLAPSSQRDRARGQERQLGRPHAQPGGDAPRGPGPAAREPAAPRRAGGAGRPTRRRARPAACRGRRAAAEPPRRPAAPRPTDAVRSGGHTADRSPTLPRTGHPRWSRVCAVGSTVETGRCAPCVGTMTLPRQ